MTRDLPLTLTDREASAVLLAIAELQNGEPDRSTGLALARVEGRLRSAMRRKAEASRARTRARR